MRFAPCYSVVLLSTVALVSVGRAQTPPPVSVWERQPDLPLARGGAAGGWIGDQLVVAGGSHWVDGTKRWATRVDIFEPQRGAWAAGPAMPAPLAGSASVSDGQRLYVVGGEAEGKATNQVWRLSHEGGAWRWSPLPELPRARVYGCLALLDQKLYFLGGTDDPNDLRKASREGFVMDLRRRSGGWRPIAPLPGAPRCLAGAAADGDALMIFGGCHGTTEGKPVNLATAAYYEPQTDRWSEMNPMPYAARAVTAAALGGGAIGLFGGYSGAVTDMESYGPAYGFERRVLVFDRATGSYRAAAPLPGPAVALVADVRGDRVAIAGGEDKAKSRTAMHFTTTVPALLKNESSRPLIVCLGDSVTAGAGRSGVRAAETYPRVLQSLMKAEKPLTWVVNAGVGGENTRQALQRVTNVFSPHTRIDAVVLMYGLNDAALVDPGPTDRVEPRIPVKEYRENLVALIRETRRQGARPILCTPNPMTPAYPYAGKGAYAKSPDINFALKPFVAAAREVALQEVVELVDIYAVFERTPNWETLFPDGIHPNATGLDLLARAVKIALRP